MTQNVVGLWTGRLASILHTKDLIYIQPLERFSQLCLQSQKWKETSWQKEILWIQGKTWNLSTTGLSEDHRESIWKVWSHIHTCYAFGEPLVYFTQRASSIPLLQSWMSDTYFLHILPIAQAEVSVLPMADMGISVKSLHGYCVWSRESQRHYKRTVYCQGHSISSPL